MDTKKLDLKSIDWNKPIVIDRRIIDGGYKLFEKLYLIVLSVFFIKTVFESSMLYLEIPFDYYYVIKYVIGFVVFFKVLFSLDKYKGKWIAFVLLGIIAYAMYYIGDFEIQLYVWMLAVGAVDVPYKKIIRIFFWTALSVVLISMVASFTGMAPHLIYEKRGNLRYSFGICYPTDFSAYVLFVTIAGWVGYGEGRERLMAVIFIAEAALLYMFCYAWCSSMVAVAAAVMCIYVHMYDKCDGSFASAVKKLVFRLEQCAYIIGAVLMIGLTAMYTFESSIMNKINGWLSGRLSLGNNAFNKYGIHAIGKYFVMRGNGGQDIKVPANYNFVDSSYVLILVRYGWMLLLALGILYVYTVNRAKKSGRETVAAAMALIALHSMIEHRYMDIAFNPFLILFFSNLSEKAGEGKTDDIKTDDIKTDGIKTDDVKTDEIKTESDAGINRGRLIRLCLLAIYVVLGIAFMRVMMSAYRTLSSSYIRGIEYQNIIFALVTFVMLASVFFVMLGMVKKDKWQIWITVGIASNLMIVVGAICLLEKGYGKYKSDIENEAEITSLLYIAEDEGCNIYVEDVPEYYSKYGYDVKKKMILGNGICTDDNAIMLVDPDKEYHRLLKSGYVYARISDNRAVYTNNPAIISRLDKDGIEIITEFIIDEWL